MKTKERGMILRPNVSSMELWCNADLCGNWNPETAGVDKENAKSRTGYIITFAGCPLIWASKFFRQKLP